MATADSLAGGGGRLKGQLSFSSRQGSLMSQISEMDSEEVGGSSPEAAGGGRGYIPGYPMGSGWEDSSALLSDNLSGIKRPRDSSEPGQVRGLLTLLAHYPFLISCSSISMWRTDNAISAERPYAPVQRAQDVVRDGNY
jgi:hypothetical protein